MSDPTKLNAIAQAVMAQQGQQAQAPQQGAPGPQDEHAEQCPMCGAMVQGADAQKLQQFMQNNPFPQK